MSKILLILCLIVSVIFTSNAQDSRLSDKASVYIRKAEKSVSENKLKKAKNYLKKAWMKSPGNSQVALKAANVAVSMGDSKLAYRYIARVNCETGCTDTTRVKIAAWKGLYAMNAGERSAARRSFSRAIYLQRMYCIDDNELSSMINNNLGVAIIFDQSRNSNSGEKECHYQKAHIRDFKSALEHFEYATDFDENNCAAFSNYELINHALDYVADSTEYGYIPDSVFSRVYLDIALCQDTVGTLEKKREITYEVIADELRGMDEIVLAVDVSGSMSAAPGGTSRFQQAVDAVKTIISKADSTIAIGMITIDGSCGTQPQHYVPVEDGDRYNLNSAVAGLHLHGSTPLDERLVESMNLFSKKKKKKRAVLLLSDGVGTCSMGDYICELGLEFSKRDISLFVFSLLLEDKDSEQAYATYNCLTDVSGGKIFGLTEEYTLEEKSFFIDDMPFSVQVTPDELHAATQNPIFEGDIVMENTQDIDNE